MFVRLRWDVGRRARRTGGHRLPVTRANAAEIGTLGALIRIDHEHAETVDLSRPLPARTPIVTDGWHRIDRWTRVTESPVIFLDGDDERACRPMGGGIKRRR